MNRSKKLWILLAVLVAACIATAAVTGYNEEQEAIKNSGEVVLELDAGAVTALSWENESGTVAFHKDGEEWVYDEDEAFPVDEEKILDLLDQFSQFAAAFTIEDVQDYAQYGLEDAACTIRVTTTQALAGVETVDGQLAAEATEAAETAETTEATETAETAETTETTEATETAETAETTEAAETVETVETTEATETAETTEAAGDSGTYVYEIRLGSFSQMDSQRYVSFGDGRVYLAQTDPLESFDAQLSDMIRNDELPTLDQVNTAVFTGDAAYTMVWQEDSGYSYQDEDQYFLKDGSSYLALDTELVEAYFDSITGLDLGTYVNYKVTEAELADYGLDSPDLTVELDYTYESEDEAVSDTFLLSVSRDPEEKAKAESEDQEDDAEETFTAYARIGDSPIVYQLTQEDYEAVMAAGYNDLRHQSIYYGDFEDVTAIDITLEETDYTITTEEDGDSRLYYLDGEEVDAAGIRSTLENLVADEFTDETPQDKEELRLTLHMDKENFPTLEIVLYRHDAQHCLAVVDGQTVAKVTRGTVMDLMEEVYGVVLAQPETEAQ